MPRQTGARTSAAFVFESTYGTAPASGYRLIPYVSTTLGAERPLIDNEVLGFGRDPVAPQRDAITVDGDIVLPIDVETWGLWLRGAFGTATVTGTVAATGSITFLAQPTANSTVTINGTVFTFVASGATGNQVNIGANLAATMTALATALNASVVAGVAAATYTGTATALNIVHDTLGTAGNSFTLAASTSPASNGTVSAATLTNGTNAHTFQSGSWTLPSASIEMMMPEVPRFAMYSGAVVNTLNWSMQRSGLLQATVGLMAQRETVAATTQAGTPTSYAYRRFGHFNGSITRNGSALANIVSADLTYSNNLDPVSVIRSDGLIDGIDPMMSSLSGSIVARVADTTLLDQAINGQPCEIKVTYDLGASARFEFTAHAVYLPQPRVPVTGPEGLQMTFQLSGAQATSPARLCTAVLTNNIVSY
jgi:hypothetical protein